jgi:hypothetical protein
MMVLLKEWKMDKSIEDDVALFREKDNIGHLATFQLYCWRKAPGALPCIISGKNGHLSRTTDVQ